MSTLSGEALFKDIMKDTDPIPWGKIGLGIGIFGVVGLIIFLIVYFTVMKKSDSSPPPTIPVQEPPAPAPSSTPAPVDCQMSEWESAGTCDCLTKLQPMTRKIIKEPVNGGKACPTDVTKNMECTPDPDKCEWQKFKNTYISSGEYMSRENPPNAKECYQKCYANPQCAAVYFYEPSKECSLIKAENVGLLYSRIGSMDKFEPENRFAAVHKGRAGTYFNPDPAGEGGRKLNSVSKW